MIDRTGGFYGGEWRAQFVSQGRRTWPQGVIAIPPPLTSIQTARKTWMDLWLKINVTYVSTLKIAL